MGSLVIIGYYLYYRVPPLRGNVDIIWTGVNLAKYVSCLCTKC